jgi:GNAT superfamily N-acetyltransferase
MSTKRRVIVVLKAQVAALQAEQQYLRLASSTAAGSSWMLIESLVDHPPDVFKQVAKWHWKAFGGYYGAGESLAERELKLGSRMTYAIPMTVVAFNQAVAPMGSASLIQSDMPTKCWTPWLASLYVHEPFRRMGVATKLIDRVISEAAALGHRKIYLWCESEAQRAFYAKRGWQDVEVVTDYIHKPLFVMVCSCT